MLTDATNPGIQPDYSDNVTVADVYTKCARLWITRERGLSILSSSLGPIQGRDLPSWVPDWRLPRRTAILRSFEWPSDDTPYYDINRGCSVSHPAPEIDATSLSVHGARLATVTSTHSARTFLAALSVALMHSDRIRRWNAFSPTFRALFSSLGYTASSAYPQTGESALMAFFRTLFADRLPEPAAMREFVAATLAKLRTVPNCKTDAPICGDARPEEAKEVVDEEEERSRYSKHRAQEIKIGPPLPARWIEGAPVLEMNAEKEGYGGGGQSDRAAATREEREMQAFLYVCDMALNILDYPLYYSRGGGSAVAIVPARQTPFVHSEARSVTDKIGSAILTFMEGRVLFKTEEGLIGIGPGYMEEGDEVWDLFGGHVPYLLRPMLPDDEARGGWDYSLVGECYVHGVMKGELWNDPGYLRGSGISKGESLSFENIRMV
ncbi:heterokaryon incompatibility protein [Neofusicoccum parvum]|nr:heterokaryon incompatibility protein [Neofusicoccum parvum]